MRMTTLPSGYQNSTHLICCGSGGAVVSSRFCAFLGVSGLSVSAFYRCVSQPRTIFFVSVQQMTRTLLVPLGVDGPAWLAGWSRSRSVVVQRQCRTWLVLTQTTSATDQRAKGRTSAPLSPQTC